MTTLSGAGVASAAPVEYVKICSLYGAGYFYVPGTDTCYNAITGETQGPNGVELNRTDLAFQGVAEAMAMPTPIIQPGDHFALAGNFAEFETTQAFSLAGAMQFTTQLSFSGGISYGVDQKTFGTRVGFNLSW